MKDNNVYNLMTQLTQEAKSLWRIKNEYLNDAGTDAPTKAFWEKLAKDKEEHIESLHAMIKERI